MNASTKNPVLTQKFATEFNCIGSMCEDDCCHGWAINIEKKTFLKLNKLYKNIENKKHVYSSALKHNKSSTNEWDYGAIKFQPDRTCPFLKQGGLCDIHARFGPNKLGWMCKDYPRSLAKANEQIELTITLSCPEAARLCLLQPNSTQLLEVDQTILSRFSGHINLPPDNIASSPYLQLHSEIRQIMLLLADARQYSTNGRLYLLLYFAHHISEFFHAHTASFSPEKLNNVIEHIADPQVHSKLISEFHAQTYDPSLSMSVTQSLLTFRSDYKSEFNEFVQSCLKSCKDINIESLDQITRDSLATIIQTYFERRHHIENAYWEKLEEYFSNYIFYFLFNRWYLTTPTLVKYLRNLLIQTSIIKFLFFLSPILDPLLNSAVATNEEGKQEQKDLLDRAIVQTVYQCTRGFEHLHPLLLEVISQALDDQGINNLEKLSILAKT